MAAKKVVLETKGIAEGSRDDSSKRVSEDVSAEKFESSSFQEKERSGGELNVNVTDLDAQKGPPQNDLRLRHLDTGDMKYAKWRKKWYQIWRPKNPPAPPPVSLETAPVIPLVNANIFSKLTYWWITDLMILGYQRTLQASDLWKMDPSRECAGLSERFDDAWARRIEAAAEWNAKLEKGEIRPSLYKRTVWGFQAMMPDKDSESDGKGEKQRKKRTWKEKKKSLEDKWRDIDGRKEPSLAWALNDVFGFEFWTGGLFKVVGDTSQLMGPVIVRQLINFAKLTATNSASGLPKPNIGRGVGMAIGLFCITVMASICQHQFFWRSMSVGVLARAALINSIYKRGIKLTPKARSQVPNSALVNHISTDVSRIDACSQWFHAAWTAPIQVTVCLAILLVQLGPSALAGFSLFVLMVPLQERLMSFQHTLGRKSMQWTDKRAKLIHEVLGAMRVVKYFSYEQPFLQRIYNIRNEELKGVQKISFSRSANIAMAFSVPVLAATLAFVTYTSTSHSFDVAIIFSSFSLFQLLRQPLMFLPRALSGITDAQNALERLYKVYHSELMTDNPIVIDEDLDVALRVRKVTFEWEESAGLDAGSKKDVKKAKEKISIDEKKPLEPAVPFTVKDINMYVPRGQLVAIVGPVGSGKSSLLEGLLGEMRRLCGDVTFGGRVGYCPQTAWIQNASLRDNILFGQPFEEERYWRVVENACLLPDLMVLPDGDLTEIGEKGINLSGGQKQRVNIARALYYDADIVLFDDPLSAVDAHVGKALFTGAIMGELKALGKTVILVTHAQHFLSQCDYIYTLVNGRISEQGTYDELMKMDGDFARLDREYGGDMEKQQDEADAEADADKDVVDKEESKKPSTEMQAADVEIIKLKSDRIAATGRGNLEGRLMVAETRVIGAVSWNVYGQYLVAGRGYITLPLMIIAMFLMQGSQIMNSYTLVWWESNTFNRPNSFYQVLYATMGISQATFTFLLGLAMDFMSTYVSINLHHNAIRNIFYAPMSLFDTTPTGRILSIFGKDIEAIDNQLSISMRLFVLTVGSVLGAVVIISVLEPYFLIAVFFIGIGYNYFAAFYRASSLETKRLDALLRSLMYSHFSESLTGLATIRSYAALPRFLKDNQYYIDLEDRALYLTITNQRWLAIRVDFLGACMTFLVAILVAVGVGGINPAQIGLVLTYTTSLTQQCGLVTRTSAEVENYMNSVERVVHYSKTDQIPQEASHEIEDKKPDPQWPQKGSIGFNNVTMSYRPGLPNVLKGISFSVGGGEKIGVVGRTGAGKSSLMLALFRIMELNEGSITIDGIDISSIGLKDLRTKVSIIPQDPLLFSGTIRSNLDPFNLHDDADLWDAMRRAYLIDTSVYPRDDKTIPPPITVHSTLSSTAHLDETGTATPTSRFTLDTVVESEGANLSVGERSLVSLARALVKDSRVVVLDEATASVDLETDTKIQHTIQTEFRDRTLLCIAHRLRTILSYDRILVLDAGCIVELDTPTNLFRNENGIFHGMCQRSNITLEEIEKSRAHFNDYQ